MRKSRKECVKLYILRFTHDSQSVVGQVKALEGTVVHQGLRKRRGRGLCHVISCEVKVHQGLVLYQSLSQSLTSFIPDTVEPQVEGHQGGVSGQSVSQRLSSRASYLVVADDQPLQLTAVQKFSDVSGSAVADVIM